MTAVEVLRVASDAGMTFNVDGSKLHVRGGSKERRAELARMIAPHAKAIASLLLQCTIGRRIPTACLACGFIHGDLDTVPPCNGCDRTCADCATERNTALPQRGAPL